MLGRKTADRVRLRARQTVATIVLGHVQVHQIVLGEEHVQLLVAAVRDRDVLLLLLQEIGDHHVQIAILFVATGAQEAEMPTARKRTGTDRLFL